MTGATRALVFDHTHRSSAVARRAADGTDIAVDEAHNDYTERSGPRRVRALLAGLVPDGGSRAHSRWQIVSTCADALHDR